MSIIKDETGHASLGQTEPVEAGCQVVTSFVNAEQATDNTHDEKTRYESSNGYVPLVTNDNSVQKYNEGTELVVTRSLAINPRHDQDVTDLTEDADKKVLREVPTAHSIETLQLRDPRLWLDGKEGKEEMNNREAGTNDTASNGGWQEERVGRMILFGMPIVTLHVDGQERLCLAQISTALLHDFSYNEIHNRRVALGITCMQCTPSQLELLRRTGAMPVTSRRCGLITKREAERLVRSFIADVPPPRLPDNFTFKVRHQCGWGNEGIFVPSRYNSSRAKCIRCSFCDTYFSPNKFIFHCHPTSSDTYRHPDAANFNSWRRHLELVHDGTDDRLVHVWEDVKAMFNGGSRKRFSVASSSFSSSSSLLSSPSSSSASGPSSCSSFPVARQTHLTMDGAFIDNMGTVSSGSQSLPNCWSWQGSKESRNAEVTSWRKAPTVPCRGVAQHMTSFNPNSSGGSNTLSLMPPSLAATAAHPAFFTNGLPGHMPLSYGEFLRSMSRPYNISNIPLTGGNTNVLPNLCRSQPSHFLQGVFSSGHPNTMNYFRYPPYLPGPATSASQSKAKQSLPSQNQFTCFPRPSTETDSKKQTSHGTELLNCQINSPVEETSTAYDTQDEIFVDEESDKQETRNDWPQNNEKDKHVEDRSCPTEKVKGVTLEDTSSLGTVDEKQDENSHNYDFRKLRKHTAFDNDVRCNEERDDKVSEAYTVVDNYIDEEKKEPTSCLPKDTDSLLAVFETTEAYETFVNLPIDILRKLYKTAKQKSLETDGQHRKIKEMQRLQRLRAEELRDELSRQFIAIKETIWKEIEHEQKLRTALQDRLTEAQKITPQTFNLFPHLK